MSYHHKLTMTISATTLLIGFMIGVATCIIFEPICPTQPVIKQTVIKRYNLPDKEVWLREQADWHCKNTDVGIDGEKRCFLFVTTLERLWNGRK